MTLTKEMQEELNKERKIKELNTVIVNQIAKAVEAGAGKGVPIGDYVTVDFDINCIPKELIELFNERQPVMFGEISDDAPISKRRYYYLQRKMVLDGNKVVIWVMKNW